MALTAGTKLGPYEIHSPLGAGGMGEVYRARDTRLDRTVAIKILPTHLSADPEFKQRFEREARTVSSLNHPHICQLFDVGQQDGTDFLVMEFLDGETLTERLRRGGIPFQELCKVGMEVAEALTAAHRAGIVHRDLKPGNVMLTKSGAKLMDFGLAKPAFGGAPGSASAPLLSAARTMSGPSPVSPLTTAGAIVGTIQYMSPEQIEGKEADARADIFAFGAVLYEMATGTRAFQGKSQISVASAILEKDPDPVSTTKPQTPAAFDYLVASCLTKDREERVQNAQDVRIQLRGIARASQSTTAVPEQPRAELRTRILLAVLGILLAATLVLLFTSRGTAPTLSVRAYVPPPPGTAFRPTGFDSGPVAVSPDGQTLAFSAIDEKGNTNLWTRPLDAAQATMLPGTEDGAYPFWSPDGRYLGFIVNRKMKKINVSGGEPQTITDEAYCCASWGAGDSILFDKDTEGVIARVAGSGGEVSALTKLANGEYAHSNAFLLPDGKHFLYNAYRLGHPGTINIGQLGKPEEPGVVVAENANWPRFASGRLLFVRSGKIMAQPFDPGSFKLSGDPRTLGEARSFSISRDGVLAYNESSAQSELKVFDGSGNAIAAPGPLAAYNAPRFSPDGKSISVTVRDPKSGNDDIWIYPTTGGQPVRATFGPNDFWAVWSPDGKEIAYGVREGDTFSVRRRALDGSKPEETVFKNDGGYLFGTVVDWSPDGKYLSLDLMAKGTGVYSNWIVPLSGSGKAFRPAASAAITAPQYDGRFSPDGRWLQYFSYESQRPEVYVIPFLSQGAKYQVTTTGGWLGQFSGTGFCFLTMGNRLMAGRVVTQPNFRLEDVHPLFQLDLPNFAGPDMDVSRDGQRFVVLTADRTKNSSITLLTNWPAALQK